MRRSMARDDARTTTSRERAAQLPETLSRVLANEDPVWRSEHFARLAAEVSDAEVEVMVRELDASLLDTSYAAILIGRWAAQSPSAAASAAEWITKLPVGTARMALLERVIRTWADADPAAAQVWSNALADPGERRSAVLQVMQAGVARRPELALRQALSLPDSPERTAVLDAALHRWAEIHPAEAGTWALTGAPDLPQAKALAVVARSMARTDPTNAAILALDGTDDPAVLQQALVAVVAAGRAGSPDSIREWIDTFPEGPLRDAAEAEWKRGHDQSDPPPARLPGEDRENRTPLVP